MLIGELAMALSPSWFIQIAGRLVSGAGGVMFNVQMTKMVTDWFAGQEIATAMAIFVNSWPAGIALSLVSLPPIATAFGIEAVYLTVAAFIALGLVFFAAAYPSPPKITTTAAAGSSWPDRKTFIALIAAGLIWGLFNVGFAVIFSFGPSMLTERGWSISAAGSVISIVLWLAVISVPLGGFLADRTRPPNLILAVGCIIFAALMVPATQRRGDLDGHCDRTTQRLAGRADHEPARACLEAADTRNRDGHLLYALLRHDDAGSDCGRRCGQIDRSSGLGLRFRNRRHSRLSDSVMGLQSAARSTTKNGVSGVPAFLLTAH